jgi:hypothetical protein
MLTVADASEMEVLMCGRMIYQFASACVSPHGIYHMATEERLTRSRFPPPCSKAISETRSDLILERDLADESHDWTVPRRVDYPGTVCMATSLPFQTSPTTPD